jgi:hypothetical protein
MPLFHVTQHRDATQYWYALIRAETAEEAQTKAESDDCEWIDGGTQQFDDREIPLDEICQVPDAYILDRIEIPTIIWLLMIDNENDDPSAEIFTDHASALIAFEAALSEYMSDKERSLYAGNPVAAHHAILKRSHGRFPYGHRVELQENRLMVTPITKEK